MTDYGAQGEPQVASLLSTARPLHDVATLPDEVDTVVIGGGIIGCATAYFLARRGLRVALFEKGRIAGEQSGRNWGWVRQQGRAAAELPMMIRSNAIWRDWVETLGEDTGFATGGCLYLARTQKDLDQHAEWLTIAREHGLDTRVIRGADLDAALSGGSGRWAGALHTPSDGRAEPSRATPAIARAAVSQGAVVCEQCAVRGLELAAGRVAGVVTERGVVRTSTVVCAAGAWSSLFAGSLGLTLPQLKVKGTVARTAPTTEVTVGAAWAPGVAIRRRRDGGYSIAHGTYLDHYVVPASLRFGLRYLPALRRERGALRLRVNGDLFRELAQPRRWALDKPTVFERTRVLHPSPSRSLLRKLRAELASSFPEIARAPFVESWAGMVDATPDLLPMIGTDDSLPGLIVATGFSGHGFGLGPGAGETIANLVTGDPSDIDLEPFRPQRFFDGSKIELGPTI